MLADADTTAACEALLAAGVSREQIVETDQPGPAMDALRAGKRVISGDYQLAAQLEAVDIVADVTWSPAIGAETDQACIEHGKDVVLVNIEADWQKAGKFIEEHGIKFAFEMHPGMLVYNVETLLKLRHAVGPMLGCNFDPSHLFWNGVDPVAAIRKLGDSIFHVHGKDCYVDKINISVNGCNDNKPYDQILNRAWTFRSIGYGHGAEMWKDIISALRLVGYDYVISIEHEDSLMSIDEGLAKGVTMLKEAGMFEAPGEMFWA